ncbi:MAG: hypothetical protein WBV55_12280 [Candidatus Sulfotelmatobacter sp.]
MSSVRKSDIIGATILAFDFLVAGPAGKYPLSTVSNPWFRTLLSAAFWFGIISAVLLPIWIGIRLVREPNGRLVKFVEFLGVLGWVLVLTHLIASEFPVI